MRRRHGSSLRLLLHAPSLSSSTPRWFRWSSAMRLTCTWAGDCQATSDVARRLNLHTDPKLHGRSLMSEGIFLTDRHISISKRLRLFDAVVSPTVLFGLAALAMSAKQREQLRVLQRRMLRLVVGWVRHEGEDWAITMRRMNGRVDDAQKIHPVRCWCDRLATLQYKLAGSLARKPSSWALRASSWHPPDTMPHAARGRGRPP